MTIVKPSPPLSQSQRRMIATLGKGLSRHFQETADEPTPDDLLQLLEIADRNQRLKPRPS